MDLPRLLGGSRSRQKTPETYRAPLNMRDMIVACQEYPGGIYIDQYGKMQPNDPRTGSLDPVSEDDGDDGGAEQDAEEVDDRKRDAEREGIDDEGEPDDDVDEGGDVQDGYHESSCDDDDESDFNPDEEDPESEVSEEYEEDDEEQEDDDDKVQSSEPDDDVVLSTDDEDEETKDKAIRVLVEEDAENEDDKEDDQDQPVASGPLSKKARLLKRLKADAARVEHMAKTASKTSEMRAKSMEYIDKFQEMQDEWSNILKRYNKLVKKSGEPNKYAHWSISSDSNFMSVSPWATMTFAHKQRYQQPDFILMCKINLATMKPTTIHQVTDNGPSDVPCATVSSLDELFDMIPLLLKNRNHQEAEQASAPQVADLALDARLAPQSSVSQCCEHVMADEFAMRPKIVENPPVPTVESLFAEMGNLVKQPQMGPIDEGPALPGIVAAWNNVAASAQMPTLESIPTQSPPVHQFSTLS